MKNKFVLEMLRFAPIMFLLVFIGELNAAVRPEVLRAKCSTPRESHRFVIDNVEVDVKKGWNKMDQRLPASSIKLSTRTRYTIKGFKKYFNWNKNRYYIHIENAQNFSDVDDFVVIQNEKGHEITYPLNCQSL